MVGRKPASVLPAPVAATSNALRPRRARSSISSWCRRGCQPLAWNQSATTGGSASGFSGVGPPAPPAFLLGIAFARRLLRAAGLPRRAPAHHEPDEHDEEDHRADDVDDPPLGYVHAFLRLAGTPGFRAYIARNGAIGFLDRVPPRGHLCAPGGRMGRSLAAKTEGADHARPFRPCARRPRRGACNGGDTGDHGSSLRAAERARA